MMLPATCVQNTCLLVVSGLGDIDILCSVCLFFIVLCLKNMWLS